jgi:hypothetical protein
MASDRSRNVRARHADIFRELFDPESPDHFRECHLERDALFHCRRQKLSSEPAS